MYKNLGQKENKKEEEIWKDIKGYEGLYQVSNLGRMKSLYRIITRKDGKKFSVIGAFPFSVNKCKHFLI